MPVPAVAAGLIKVLPYLLSIIPFLKTAPKTALKKSRMLDSAIKGGKRIKGREVMRNQSGTMVTIPPKFPQGKNPLLDGLIPGRQIPVERAMRMQQKFAKKGRFAPTAGRATSVGFGGMLAHDVATGNLFKGGGGPPTGNPMEAMAQQAGGPAPQDAFLMELLQENPEIFKQLSQFQGMPRPQMPPKGPSQGMMPPQGMRSQG